MQLKTNGQRAFRMPTLLNPYAGAIASVAGPRNERQTCFPLGTTTVQFKRGVVHSFTLPRRL